MKAPFRALAAGLVLAACSEASAPSSEASPSLDGPEEPTAEGDPEGDAGADAEHARPRDGGDAATADARSDGNSGGPVTFIAAGDIHTCVGTSTRVKCWGANMYGQLGNGTDQPSSLPVEVTGIVTGASSGSARSGQTCVVVGGGTVKCWGANAFGVLGDGTKKSSRVPVQVVGIINASAVSAGANHTCALANGGVKCWGSNHHGRLGTPFATESFVPIDVPDFPAGSGVTALSVGDAHACVVAAGSVQCWGENTRGMLGHNLADFTPHPRVVAGTSGASRVAGGWNHSCAVVGTGIKCWGFGWSGQLGRGSELDSASPVDVVGLAGPAIDVVAGNGFTCALLQGGHVQCWGTNDFRQLGDGTSDLKSLVPRTVAGLASGVISLAAGSYHACAQLASGGVKCWGQNSSGQVGNGEDGANVKTPQSVVGL